MATVMAVEDDAIAEVVLFCDEQIGLGETLAPDRTYEDGIRAALNWVTGATDVNPLDAPDVDEENADDLDFDADDDADGQD